MIISSMRMSWIACAVTSLLGLAGQSRAEDPTIHQIWPTPPAGTEAWSGPEQSFDAPVNGTPLKMVTNVTTPTLTVIMPKKRYSTGAGFIVVPGGGFQMLSIDSEGMEVGRWLADRGIVAFVLKYRVRMEKTSSTNHEGGFDGALARAKPSRLISSADATQALAYVRGKAESFGVEPSKIGMIGFSAGAMTVADVLHNSISSRPALGAMIYGAMEDLDVPENAPPVFMAAAYDDPLVPAEKSVEIFQAWHAKQRSAELHIFANGGHGFGMRLQQKASDAWTVNFEAWLQAQGWLATAAVDQTGDAKSPQDP